MPDYVYIDMPKLLIHISHKHHYLQYVRFGFAWLNAHQILKSFTFRHCWAGATLNKKQFAIIVRIKPPFAFIKTFFLGVKLSFWLCHVCFFGLRSLLWMPDKLLSTIKVTFQKRRMNIWQSMRKLRVTSCQRITFPFCTIQMQIGRCLVHFIVYHQVSCNTKSSLEFRLTRARSLCQDCIKSRKNIV